MATSKRYGILAGWPIGGGQVYAPDKGVGAPWAAFGGRALRANGKTLRILSKSLVIE